MADASVREQRWTRVVVTLGTHSQQDDAPSAATMAALSRGQQRNASQNRRTKGRSLSVRSEHPSSGPQEVEEGSIDFDDGEANSGNGVSSRWYPDSTRNRVRLSSMESLPCLTTYVNSKKCSCVSASTRGVIGVRDGRFAINTLGFNLFSSSQTKYMPGLLVRYVELQPMALSEVRIKEAAFSNRIYSAWDKDQVCTTLKLYGVNTK